jgi:hypothetical protein
VPVAYGVGVAAGCILLTVALFNLLAPSEPHGGTMEIAEVAAVLPQLAVLSTFATVSAAAQLVSAAAALPLAAYGFFLVYHLLIDVVQAVLALPKALARLAPGEEGIGEDDR